MAFKLSCRLIISTNKAASFKTEFNRIKFQT
nr:MAG TPA: hypothetical protein [Caudoviricetes sp.]